MDGHRGRLVRRQARRAGQVSGPSSHAAILGTSILELQGLAGNAAVARMLSASNPTRIARAIDAPAPALEAPSAALDDPSFNAEGIAHDLLRAIDQSQHTFVMD